MNPRPPSHSPPVRRDGFVSKRFIVLVLCGILGALTAWHVLWRAGNAAGAARCVNAARQRGEPVTVAELAATHPQIPESENIYIALEQIWASEDPEFWSAFKSGRRPLPDQREETFDPDLPVLGKSGKITAANVLDAKAIDAMRRFLAAKQSHLDAVRAAIKRKSFRAPYNFEEGYQMLLPHLARIRKDAQFFQISALDAIERGEHDQAINDIISIAQLGRCLRNDPLLIGQLVHLAINTIAINTFERLLTHSTLSEAELQRIAGIVTEMRADDGLKRALIGERVFGWSLWDENSGARKALATSSSGQTDTDSFKSITQSFRWMTLIGLKSAETRLMGETYDRALRCIENPQYATNDQLHEIFKDMSVKAKGFPPRTITYMLMSALDKAGDKFAQWEALRRCAEAAIVIERQRLTRGGILPESGALGGSLPADPFDGQPLRFKRTADGYLVYSIGPDRKDNGGTLERPKSSTGQAEFDVGLRIERRPQT